MLFEMNKHKGVNKVFLENVPSFSEDNVTTPFQYPSVITVMILKNNFRGVEGIVTPHSLLIIKKTVENIRVEL